MKLGLTSNIVSNGALGALIVVLYRVLRVLTAFFKQG